MLRAKKFVTKFDIRTFMRVSNNNVQIASCGNNSDFIDFVRKSDCRGDHAQF